MDSIKKILLLIIVLLSNNFYAQEEEKAKLLLDEVSNKMESYTNLEVSFITSLVNKVAGVKEGDEPPLKGKILLQGEKYSLEYLRNTFIFNGKKLYVINHDDKEISINEDDLSEDEGFIYPSKLISFYKEGYNYKMGAKLKENGKDIQFVELIPIDSDSEIIKVDLGIDVNTKHIYQLIQTGQNGAITTLTIKSLKTNQDIKEAAFELDKVKYEKLGYLID